MPFGGLLTAGLISGGASIIGSLFGSHAATSAADRQAQTQQQALDFQKQQFSTNQANQAPFISAGGTSLSKIMELINSGQFGPGSIPTPQGFQAPTLADAQNSPGYQFTQQQGNKGILQGASAAGGAVSGGTLKALAGYDTNLANNTYGDVFSRAFNTHNAQLADYQAALQGQAQGFGQLSGIASLGENAAAGAGNVGVQTGAQVGQTLSNLGTAQASGIVGSANAINGGLGSIASLAQLYGLINSQGVAGGSGAGGGGVAGLSTDGSMVPVGYTGSGG